MRRTVLAALVLLGTLTTARPGQSANLPAENDGRVWVYGNYTAAVTPNWSFTVMPGARFEFARSGDHDPAATRQFYLYEVFAGPNYLVRFGNLTLKGSLWYYYTGFPQRRASISATAETSRYNAAHNVEVIPSVDYKFGRLSVLNRVIFHNTFFADVYTESSQKMGYGLVLRELVQARYAVNDRLGISLGDEPFFGLIEDGGTKDLANGAGFKGPGYWKKGLRLNRVYLGVDFKVLPNLLVSPMYVWETNLSPVDSSDITAQAHYLFVTFSYVHLLFSPKK